MDIPKPPLPIPPPPYNETAALRDRIAQRCANITASLTAGNQTLLALLFDTMLEKLEQVSTPVNTDGTLTDLQKKNIETALRQFDAQLASITAKNQFDHRVAKLSASARGADVAERIEDRVNALRSKYDVDKYYMFRVLSGKDELPPSIPPPHFDFPNEEDAVVPFIEKLERELSDTVEKM